MLFLKPQNPIVPGHLQYRGNLAVCLMCGASGSPDVSPHHCGEGEHTRESWDPHGATVWEAPRLQTPVTGTEVLSSVEKGTFAP